MFSCCYNRSRMNSLALSSYLEEPVYRIKLKKLSDASSQATPVPMWTPVSKSKKTEEVDLMPEITLKPTMQRTKRRGKLRRNKYPSDVSSDLSVF